MKVRNNWIQSNYLRRNGRGRGVVLDINNESNNRETHNSEYEEESQHRCHNTQTDKIMGPHLMEI